MKGLLTIFIVCCSKLLFAQKSPFPDSCNTVLWGVVNASGDTSYLFGTFHEFGNAFFDAYVPQRLYRQANCVVTESKWERISKPKVTVNWVKKLSRQDRLLIKRYMKRSNSEYNLRQMKQIPAAWVTGRLISALYQEHCHTWTDQDVVRIDEYIANGALSHNKKWLGLESPNDTFNVINMMIGAKNNEDTIAITTLKNLIIHEDKYIDTIVAGCSEADNYRSLSINYRFNQPSKVEHPDFPLMLDRRNDAWMPQVKNIIDSNKAFIAVGMKHLFFNKGLIMQLLAYGYKPFPIAMIKREVHYSKGLKR